MLIGAASAIRRAAAFLLRRAAPLASDVSGTTLVEYVLIASLVSAAIIGGVDALGLEVGKVFVSLGDALADL